MSNFETNVTRVSKDILKEEGTRVSLHSKFYLWNDILWEPVKYKNRLTGTYKPIKDTDRILKIMARVVKDKKTVRVSKVTKNRNTTNRFELMDLDDE